MITFAKCLLLFATFSTLNLIQNVKSEKALIFNFEDEELVTPRELMENIGVSWHEVSFCLLACPSDSLASEETLINEERSITENGIFAKYIYESEVMVKNIDFCDKPFKPTTVLNESTNLIETGYELFYKEDALLSLDYENYNQLKKIYGQEVKEDEKPTDSIKVKKIDDEENTKFQALDSNSKWVYFWISVLSIKADKARRQISFTKDTIRDKRGQRANFSEVCTDYSLGDKSQSNSSREKIEGLREMANQGTNSINSVEITQIMPMRYFHSHSAELATCSEFNLAFIRSGIVPGYSKVDSYLYAIYKAWPSEVNIIFGVQGAVQTIHNESADTSLLKDYTMPIPELFYRIVEYHQRDVILNVIIVIHNDTGTVPNGKRICSVQEEVPGWDEMKVKNPTRFPHNLGLAYACRVTEENIKKLQADYTVTGSMRPFILNEDTRRSIKPGENYTCIMMSELQIGPCRIISVGEAPV